MLGAAVVTKAEGLQLHLSSSNRTGYKGVTTHHTGRFHPQHQVRGRQVSLGLFDTAVAAAVG